MKVFRSSRAAAQSSAGCALAIGNFDGVHLGHQALLERSLMLAREHSLSAVALTFDPHPGRYFRPESAPLLINTEEQKLALLGAFGLDAVVVEPFDAQLVRLSPELFIEDRLVGRLRAKHVIVGESFVFGRGRAGSVETLREQGSRLGFEVHGLGTVEVDGQPVSSTRIRECIGAGDVEGAHQLMGRPFALEGRVVSGAGRGRTIGIPTANLEPDGRLVPARGVYAGRATVDGDRSYSAVVNVGYAPTFEQEQRTRIEAHLLGFDGELKWRRLEIAFASRLRPEQRFANADELVRAIRRDIERAIQLEGSTA